MHAFEQKPNASQQAKSEPSTLPGRAYFGQSREVNSRFHLQRTTGNQTVQRVLQTHTGEFEAGLFSTVSPRFALDFSQIPVHAMSLVNLQTKLAISQPGDKYEREADRVSEQVMRMPEPRLKRACDGCGSNRKYPKLDLLQAKSTQVGGAGASEVPQAVHDVLGSTGRPLDSDTKSFFEPRFGHDFSQVRLHTNHNAAKAAKSVNGLAFTVGPNIVFDAGTYGPATKNGRRLLAHELAHVVQQGAALKQEPAVRDPIATATVSGDTGADRLSSTRPILSRNGGAGNQPGGGSPLYGQNSEPAPLPTVTVGHFRNSGSTADSGENNCVKCPKELGVHTSDFRNGMELRGDIVGHVPGAQYDFKRTMEGGAWFEQQGVAVWQDHHVGPGETDDKGNDDEQLTPVNNHIYVEDIPGFKSTNFPYANLTQAVMKASFVEWVDVRVGTGQWKKSSNEFEWHSVVWLKKVDGTWQRVAGKNEIEPGSITVGTGDTL